MPAALMRHWFLIALIGVQVSGLVRWRELEFLLQADWLRKGAVFLTMFVLTWAVPIRQLLKSFRQPGPAILAFSVNLVAIPLMAWPLAGLLGSELGPGLIVLAATPSTLASAAVWTRRAGGNDVVAIMNTLLTNGLCFIILPAWVWWLHGPTGGQQDFWQTAQTLLLLVVLPMVLSQLARGHRRSAEWATNQKSLLGLVAQTGILVMVLLASIQTGSRLSGASPPGPGLLVLMVMVAGLLHLVAWWLGFTASGALGMAWPDRVAVGFSGSQKTLMIGLTTAMELQLSILPLVAYHILQLVIDTLIADRLRKSQVSDNPVA